jgi:NDP-sugar pyrophosphorylase family protein
MLANIEAVILCGGLGSRLRTAVPDRAKCLAPVGDRPFLEYVLLQLRAAGIRHAKLCVGYRSGQVAEYFENGSRWGIRLTYSEERQALGTAGALRNAGANGKQQLLVLNGDSILELDLEKLIGFHHSRRARATLALAHAESGERFGAVHTDALGNVIRFEEKTNGRNGDRRTNRARINGGVYVLNREILEEIPIAPPPVSLEVDIFPKLIGRGFYGFPSEGYFIDIGVPDDYRRAQRELPRRFGPC